MKNHDIANAFKYKPYWYNNRYKEMYIYAHYWRNTFVFRSLCNKWEICGNINNKTEFRAYLSSQMTQQQAEQQYPEAFI